MLLMASVSVFTQVLEEEMFRTYCLIMDLVLCAVRGKERLQKRNKMTTWRLPNWRKWGFGRNTKFVFLLLLRVCKL